MTDGPRTFRSGPRGLPPAALGHRAFGGRMRAAPVLDGPRRDPAGRERGGGGDLRPLPRPVPERGR